MDRLKIFKQGCINHYFELRTSEEIEKGNINIPTYLSLGQELTPATVKETLADWTIFASHRCHSWYLSFGGDILNLALELLGKSTGMCGSASIYIKDKMYGHSGLLGDNIPIATGFAHASQKPTLCVAGDAAYEEDYALGALGYAVTKKCPILFLCEDNNLSILTEKKIRRSWDICKVAQGFGLYSIDIDDNPEIIYNAVKITSTMLPALINIRTIRHRWHAGYGQDNQPKYDRFEIFKTENMEIFGTKVKHIAIECKNQVDSIWNSALCQN